jgi:hypothetical protein
VHTAGEKNFSTGIRFKQVILKGFLRLDLQPVQLIFPTSITDKKIHQPSKDIRGAAAAFLCHYYLLRP